MHLGNPKSQNHISLGQSLWIEVFVGALGTLSIWALKLNMAALVVGAIRFGSRPSVLDLLVLFLPLNTDDAFRVAGGALDQAPYIAPAHDALQTHHMQTSKDNRETSERITLMVAVRALVDLHFVYCFVKNTDATIYLAIP